MFFPIHNVYAEKNCISLRFLHHFNCIFNQRNLYKVIRIDPENIITMGIIQTGISRTADSLIFLMYNTDSFIHICIFPAN